MDEASARRLRELEERVRQLQEENEHLAERQADTTLLGLVSEHLHLAADVDGILRVALEQASILKDVPACAVGDLAGGRVVLRHAYLARSAARLDGRVLALAPRVAEELEAGAVLLEGEACREAGLDEAALDGLRPGSALLLPFSCRPVARGAFVFADDAPGPHLASIAPVLARVVDAVTARLENVALLQELLALNAALDERVAERTRALTAANLELAREMAERRRTEEGLRQAQKLESIGRLAGGVAHDFNNLLTTILGVGELLAADLPPGGAQAADLATILDAARHAAALTRQLLAFGRKQRLEVRPVRLEEVCRSLSAMLARTIGEEIAIHLDLDVAAPAVLADRPQLEQVLMNLAINARDAMPGGGRLSIAVAAVAPAEAAGQGLAAGRWVRLSVADTGAGMTPEVAAQAFEPFFTTKERGQGTGLGLATVYGVVSQHGGQIRLATAPGRGTRFDLFFPAAGAEAARGAGGASAPEAAHAAPRGRGETVLVVDDEASVRRVLRAVLTRLGYEVVEAAGGQEARSLLDGGGGPFDLLLTDVVMPGLRGPELARGFQARWPGRPVVLMSGYAEGRDRDVEVAAFLQKPITPEALARTVRAALDAARRPG